MFPQSLTDWASSVHYFKAVLENIDTGVALIEGAERRIVLVNGALCAILGVTRDQLIGARRPLLIDRLSALSADPDQIAESIGAIPPTGAYDESSEFTLERPVRRVIAWSARPVPIPSGIGQLCLFRDITAQTELTRQYMRDALVDPLTGLGNRRAADDVLQRELNRATRSGRPFSIAVFDVDGFKRVNDEGGHQAGDGVLKAVARVLRDELRACDTAARLGGDELLVTLPYVSVEGAVHVAERIRARAEGLDAATGLGVTLSSGVAEWRPGQTTTELLAEADARLYEAKRRGKNRVFAGELPATAR